MKLILVVEPAAEKDMLSGYRWYEKRRVGLGVKFHCNANPVYLLATMHILK